MARRMQRTTRASRDADLVLVDADIRTMDRARPRAKGIAFGGGRVLAAGANAQAERWAGDRTEVIALEGKVVVPGFIDAHAHLMESAAAVGDIPLGACASRGAAVEAIRKAASRAAAGEWIIARDWDESRWPDPRYLTREDLDRASEAVPIAAERVDRHMAAVNSAGLGVLSISAGTRGYETDAAGVPTGVLKEDALARLWDAVWPAPAQLAGRFRSVAAEALRLGITTVHDIVGHDEVRAYQIARSADALPLRALLLPRHRILPHLRAAGLTRGFGDESLRLGGIKVFADGSLGARTAALLEPYADDPAERGMLIHPPADLRGLLAGIHGAGFQAAVHAIGDRAIELAIEAIEAIAPVPGARHRIEHAELPRPEHVERMARLGIVAVCQPNFVGQWSVPGGLYETRLGPGRTARNNPYRELVEAGVVLAFGSDGMPYGPLEGIHWAVNAPLGGQRLTVDEAFAAYTAGAAWAGFEEGQKGTLAPGKLGDAVVLDGDPWREPGRIRSLRVAMAVVGGARARLDDELKYMPRL